MNTKDVERLFAYDQWANRRLVAAAALVSADDFSRDLGASFGSLRGTLLHVLWGERRWLHRWVDGGTIPDPSLEDFPTAAALERNWAELNQRRATYVKSLSDASLEIRLEIRGQEFQLADLITHVTNHSTYHRGQVALLLRQLGHTPPATDFRLWVAEGGPAAA